MDGSREPRDLFSDPNAKKIEQHQQNNIPPVKRPRQKGLHFDLSNSQQARNDYPPGLSMQIPGFYPEVTVPGNDVGRWYPELPHYPRRDTPVPENDIEVEAPPVEDLVPPPTSAAVVHNWLRKNQPQRHQRPLQPMEHFVPRKPHEEPTMLMGHPPFPVETLEDRIATSPFSSARTERDRFVELMGGPPPPPVFDPHVPVPPGMTVMPQPHLRKVPPPAGGLFGEDDAYDNFSSAFAAAKEWGGKESEALAGQRLRQARRSRAPGPNREPDLGAYFARQNGLFDPGYQAEQARNAGRISVMRERLRLVEQRHNPLEDNREQEGRATMERHRPRQQNRERRMQCRGGGEFGALMNALGLVPDDDIPGNARDSSSGISRMREAVFGIVNSRLPPHLLFSDRDFDGDDYEFLSRLDDSVESRKGADDQIINKINLCAFGSGGLPIPGAMDVEPRCPICLENFAQGVEIRVMPCQHKYHRCCLDKWLKIKAVCPICNMNIKDKFLADASKRI